MNERLHQIDLSRFNAQSQAITALESGQVLYLPHTSFSLNENEKVLLTESILHPKHKNISYNICSKNKQKDVSGVNQNANHASIASLFMHRFTEYAKLLIDTIIPQYSKDLIWGRTSYRPAEIRNRNTSPRKDDTRLHVDSFPSTPVNGLRILRVFCNINPNGCPRTWELGEPFETVLKRFFSSIPPYHPFQARLLHWIKATKTFRSRYDHFMLNLHDKMKLSDDYQQSVKKQRIDFPAQSTWVVFTDHVSHAALSGQFLLEQTFYLPVFAMQNPSLSPLKQWESLTA